MFVLPSVVVLWVLAYVYMVYGDVPWVAAALTGLKPAVLAVVAAAVIRIGKKALKNQVMWGIVALAFISIFFLKAPFPLIVVGAGVAGWIGSRLRPDVFVTLRGKDGPDCDPELADTSRPPASPTLARSLSLILICAAIWSGLHILFPSGSAPDWFGIAVCCAAFVALLRWNVDIL